MEKRKEATIEEVNLSVQEYEDSMKKLEDSGGSEDPKIASSSGRRVFGMAKAQTIGADNKVELDKFYNNSDSEDDFEAKKSGNIENEGSDHLQKDVIDDLVIDTRKDSVFKVINFLFSWTAQMFVCLFYLMGITQFMHFLKLDHRTLMRL